MKEDTLVPSVGELACKGEVTSTSGAVKPSLRCRVVFDADLPRMRIWPGLWVIPGDRSSSAFKTPLYAAARCPHSFPVPVRAYTQNDVQSQPCAFPNLPTPLSLK
jgi:hypothetical protein